MLNNLQILSLGGNPITTLPPGIGNLSNLRCLYVWQCGLSSLPNEFGKLKNLQILEIYGNSIGSLPASIGDLQSLQQLNMHGNPLMSLPPEFAALNLQELLMDAHLCEKYDHTDGGKAPSSSMKKALTKTKKNNKQQKWEIYVPVVRN